MTDRPILFSGPMVRALIEGQKHQTRRVLKPQPPGDWPVGGADWVPGAGVKKLCWLNGYDGSPLDIIDQCPYYPGQRLWTKHSADLFPVYFKPIPGWEGLYSAGTDGLIYRVDSGAPSPLKGSADARTGYLRVTLCRDGTCSNASVHRLVASAFYGPCDGAVVRHMDGDRQNNVPENLDWGSYEDNWGDRLSMKRGCHEGHHNAKLTRNEVAEIKASSERPTDLAARFGVDRKTIYWIRKGRTWAEKEQPPRNTPPFTLWKSPLFMPRWASRLTLEVTDVRVQRVQEISEEDAVAEGLPPYEYGTCPYVPTSGEKTAATHRFRELWDSLNAKRGYGWDENPWVVAVTFRPHHCNIDQMEGHGDD